MERIQKKFGVLPKVNKETGTVFVPHYNVSVQLSDVTAKELKRKIRSSEKYREENFKLLCRLPELLVKISNVENTLEQHKYHASASPQKYTF